MPSVYPSSIPTYSPPPATQDLVQTHPDRHIQHQEDIVALATENGVSPSGTYSSVRARLDAITTQIATIRHRRHRNGVGLAGTTTVAMFVASSSGSLQENVGGITFTTNATNGFFTVPSAGTYALTQKLDPSIILGSTSALNFIIAGSAHQMPVIGGSVFNDATLVTYLAASTTVAFSATNNAAAMNADTWECEITRLVAAT